MIKSGYFLWEQLWMKTPGVLFDSSFGDHLSRADFEKLFVTPMVLEQKSQEYIGNDKYPEGLVLQQVRVQAMLLGTQEEALEAKGK